MLPDHPIIAIVGSGAVGGYYGCRLARIGHDIHFFLRSDYDAVARNGWIVRSREGDFTVAPDSIHVYNDPSKMPPADLVIVALKATANDQSHPLILPLLHQNTLILTLQNGLGNEEHLADLFGPQRILGGLAFVCLNRIAPGIINHTDYGFVRVGEFIEGNTANASKVVAMLASSGVKCELLHSLRYGRWEKLLWNVPFNGLGAVLDMATDRLINDPAGLELVRQIMSEVVAAANALGAPLPQELIESRIDFTKTMGAYRSSMQIDRELGRDMEVEAILGQPLRAAANAHVATPYMNMLYQLAKLVSRHTPQ